MTSEVYRRSFVPNGAIYLTTVGYGTGALLGRGIKRVAGVYWLEELGLAQAVWVFERVPLDSAMVPPVGEKHEAYSLAERLGMSEARLSRLALAAGVRQVVRSRRRPAPRPRTVVVAPALRDAHGEVGFDGRRRPDDRHDGRPVSGDLGVSHVARG